MQKNAVAVIFANQRTTADAEGYAAAAAAMVAAAERQPGYLGIHSVRDESGFGITVSYWADDAAAQAWRDDPAHSAIRGQGRAGWYEWYDLQVATVIRAYDWRRGGD
ncbi:antibiotic biosynthesis monooxygenase [Sphingomonas sp. ID0503]|uniref:antibiotic biosynthesis monooxygenase n=1 Tax=Sphingomonas sp. ID0503 TaxID=3399691 RepID=UPI003AFB11AE